MATDGDPSSNPNHRDLLDLLKVDVVKDEILSYLNFQDLKCFSEVSKDALSVVRKSRRYRRKATLVIGPDAVKTNLESVKDVASTWPGKKVKIDVAIPIELLRSRSLETLLMNVESVTLHLSNTSRAYNAVGSLFKEVLEKAKNLKHLELDPVILVKCGQVLNAASRGAQFEWTEVDKMFYHRDCYAHAAFLKDNFPTILKNLETLKIMGGSQLNWPSPRFFKLETGTFVQLNKLASIMGNLKKLSSYLNCGGARAFYPDHPDFTSDYAEGLLKIIKRNMGTLEELEIGDIDIVRFTEIGNIATPKLKRLAILDSKVSYARILEDFLAKRPQLDYLNISVVNKLLFRIFKVIEEKQTKLTDLRIRVRQFDPAGGMDWSFLKKFSGLKCLVIRQVNMRPVRSTDGYYGYGEDILNSVPSSVKILVIEGFRSFWKQITPAVERNIWRRLSHLKNLEQLSLHRSKDAFSDVGLQDLISNCPKLTALCISHCSHLSKFGVTGEDSNGERTGVSLDQLKGLRHLSIRYCTGIRKVDLFPAIKFDFLTGFYFDGLEGDEIYFDIAPTLADKQKKKMELIAGLLSENPCLEELGIRLSFTARDDCRKVKQMSRRLTHVALDLPTLQLGDNELNVSENDSALPLRRY